MKIVRDVKVHLSNERDDFINSIWVIRLCQNLVGACRVSIRGKHIYTRCLAQKIMLLCLTCIATSFYYLALTMDDMSESRYHSVALNVCLSAFSFYCEVIIITVTSKDTAYLMKICQNIGKKAPNLKQNIFKDWLTYVTIFAIIQYFVRGITILNYIFTSNTHTFATKYSFNTFVSYLSELDVLMWVKICAYLKDHLQNLNAVLREKSKNIYTQDFNSQNCLYLFERCTFCFIYVLKLYRWTILFFYVNFLIWTITLFRTVTAGTVTEWEVVGYTLLKKLMFIAVISYTTEMYKRVCDETGQTCYDILDNHDKGELKDLADVMLYLLHEMPPTTQIGGLLHLDFKLFFQFVSQMISYTVIILQFSNFKSN